MSTSLKPGAIFNNISPVNQSFCAAKNALFDIAEPCMHLMISREWVAKMWKAISHKPVDFDSVPKFVERDLMLGESLRLAIWDIGLLVLFNLVLFAAAFVSFLRYDVR